MQNFLEMMPQILERSGKYLKNKEYKKAAEFLLKNIEEGNDYCASMLYSIQTSNPSYESFTSEDLKKAVDVFIKCAGKSDTEMPSTKILLGTMLMRGKYECYTLNPTWDPSKGEELLIDGVGKICGSDSDNDINANADMLDPVISYAIFNAYMDYRRRLDHEGKTHRIECLKKAIKYLRVISEADLSRLNPRIASGELTKAKMLEGLKQERENLVSRAGTAKPPEPGSHTGDDGSYRDWSKTLKVVIVVLLIIIAALIVFGKLISWSNGSKDLSDGKSSDNIEAWQSSNNSSDSQSQSPGQTRSAAPEITDVRDYIIPDSNSRLLDEYELAVYSNAELVIARNEIYARHGYIFKSKILAEWFQEQLWYSPVYASDAFPSDLLSSIEKKNITLLLEYRDKRNKGDIIYQGSGAEDLYYYRYFYDSDRRYIEEDEVKYMTKDDLEIAIQEIYAHNGREFTDPRWREYYKSFTWYTPSVPDGSWSDDRLNAYELENLELLRYYLSLN